jgi:hypothetical protein
MIRIGFPWFVVAVVLSRKESLSFLNYLNSLSLRKGFVCVCFFALPFSSRWNSVHNMDKGLYFLKCVTNKGFWRLIWSKLFLTIRKIFSLYLKINKRH